MIIENKIDVRAPINEVWDFLLNIEEMSKCMPGVESVTKSDGSASYTGTLKIGIGPITAQFSGHLSIKEIKPPTFLSAELSGDDRASASFVKATFTANLEPVDEGTRLHYKMDLTLRGRLAQFGTAVVNATAKKMTADFAENLRAKLET